MKAFFRIALLLGFVGVCYGLGRRHGIHTTQAQVSEEARQKKAALAAKARRGPSYTKFETIRAILTNPNLSWKEKDDRLHAPSSYEINPADLPNLIRLIEELPALGNDLAIKKSLLDDFFDRLGDKDPMLTLSLLKDYPDPQQRTQKMAEALGALAASDPQKALAMLAELPQGNSHSLDFYLGWAGADRAGAMTAALSLPPGSNRNDILENLSDAWAQQDPMAALNWAESLPNMGGGMEDPRTENIRDALEDLFENDKWDMPTVLAAINTVPDDSSRNDLIRIPINELASYNPSAAMDWINQTASPGTSTYYQGINDVFQQIPTSGVTGNASTLLSKISDPDARAVAIDAIANQNSTDAGTLLAWAQSLPDTDAAARTDAINSILGKMAANDPTSAAAFVQNAADPSAYLSAVPAIAQNLAVSDPQAALDWVNNLPDGAGKNQAIGNILATLAQTDVDSAWSYAASLPAGSSQDAVMTTLVTATAPKDPALAASLAEQMPSGSAQVSAITAVSTTWVDQDPQAFTTWLTGLPEGEVRDAAIQQLASSSQATKNPAGVLQWVNTVSNAPMKAALLQKLGQN